FGRILDPFVDKVLVIGTLLFLLGRSGSGQPPTGPGVTPAIVAVVAFRELFVTALRAEVEKLGADFSADRLGKAKTATQCVVLTGVLLGLGAGLFTDSAWRLARDASLWGMTLLTAWSGVAYTARGFRAIAGHSDSEADAVTEEEG
ncbi:MAG: CDP-alcohol phosphatidyltransferase family protein, partial [Planctomycetota bacterium]